MIDFSPAIGTVGGKDFSGQVVVVGARVQRWSVGDSVCGFLYGLDPHVGEKGWAGAFAHAGYIPLATCSPSNFDLVKSFGAEKAFDYHSPSCGVSIRAFTKGKLQKALDCITDSGSMRICYTAMGPRGDQWPALEPPSEKIKQSRKDIEADWVMALTIFGKDVDLKGPSGCAATPGDKDWARSWYTQAEGLVADGFLRPHPAKLANGNWTDVLQGIDELRSGKVRGVKFVYEID
ncbi:hypothetical protein QQS21_004220 [Conoideocrella luteorostrata]|uniref:Uncharacterized protein n=1 Tax=Conoideocrella luteorostrata TaxID=1105319 RepID=A0AAJ0FUX2_9HYPO|nr:hypothetical protein QQS21_004220 [Conoideocrella luteorostrata]